MTTGPTNRVLTYLRRFALLEERGVADAQLLERFLAGREESAFAELVRRHGPLVLGVCRRVLGEAQADDAFQATFLVLVRKASSIVPRSRVGPWLYGVARRTALKARCAAARRRRAEQEAARVRPNTMPPADLGDDLRPLFDEEMGHLPEKYRAPLVLCLVEGRSRKEAAGLLNWSEGTLSGRLARAKELLGARLRRRGVALTGAALLAALADSAAAAEVPPALALATVQAATAFAGPAGATALSRSVVALTQEVMKAMLMSKLKVVAGVLVLVAGIGLGAAVTWPSGTAAQGAAPPATEPYGKGPDASEKKEVAKPVAYVIEPPDVLLVKYAPADGADPVKIDGQRLVRPDGTIGLGQFGSVFVSGKTLAEGRAAIAEHLARRLDGFDPTKLTVEVVAANSKVFYLIVDNAEGGEVVYRFPATGNETVVDAIAKTQLVWLGQKDVWIARMSNDGKRSRVLPVDLNAITQHGKTETNYQLLPGDRLFIKNPAPKKAEASPREDAFRGANSDPVRRLEAVVKALREARSEEERQRVVEDLEALTRTLREQLNKPEDARRP
jgi:polysaccharide export outer membrane protein